MENSIRNYHKKKIKLKYEKKTGLVKDPSLSIRLLSLKSRDLKIFHDVPIKLLINQ